MPYIGDIRGSDKEERKMKSEFRNEPLTDFKDVRNEREYDDALRHVTSELGKEYAIVIGGERISTNRQAESVNPAAKDQIVGTVSQADTVLAEKAIQTATTAFEAWKSVHPDERARYLYKCAALMRRRKHEFSAWLTYEAGKTREEADADTAEAIRRGDRRFGFRIFRPEVLGLLAGNRT
jgi:1-pyrroline-5-carboxylate dehydrogenase